MLGIKPISIALLALTALGCKRSVEPPKIRTDLTIQLQAVLKDKGNNGPSSDEGKLCQEQRAKELPVQLGNQAPETLFEIAETLVDEEEASEETITVRLERFSAAQAAEKTVDVLSLQVENNGTVMGDDTGGILVRRYLATQGEVTKLESGSFGSLSKREDRVTALVETELKKMYSASQATKSSESFEGLGKPDCQVKVSGYAKVWEDWELSQAIIAKKEFRLTQQPNTSYWTKPEDTAIYAKAKDGVLSGYQLRKPIAFEWNGNSYSCFGLPDKGDDQGRPLIVSETLQSISPLAGPRDIGSIYKPGDAAVLSAFTSMQESLKGYEQQIEVDPDEQAKNLKALTLDEYKSKDPILYIKDPFARVHECRAKNLEVDISKFVEPLIYVYTSEPQQVLVQLGKDIWIDSSKPLHQENSWSVMTSKSGYLRMVADGQVSSGARVPFLFWEGRGREFPKPPKEGRIVRAEELDGFLSETLAGFGLSEREARDFKAYWVPALSQYPSVLIDFLVNEQVDAYAPLVTTPAMPQLRVYLSFKPVAAAMMPVVSTAPIEPKQFPKLERPRGDLLVEWGGVQWSKHQGFGTLR